MTTPILVTGGAGYIGSHVCKALAKRGFLPVTIDNLSRGHREAVRWGPLVEGDLSDGRLVRHALTAHGVKAVIHLAAYAYVGESMERPNLYYMNNVVGSLSLLDAMQDAGVEPIVFSSSCSVYGAQTALPISEDRDAKPISPYGETKLAIERALHWCAPKGLRPGILRYFNAAGADPDGELGEDHDPEPHLIPLAILTALGKRPSLSVFGNDYPTPDGTAIRDYVHVQDLADAHLRMLDRLLAGDAGRTINLGTRRGSSVLEVVREVERRSGHPLPVRFLPRRPGDMSAMVADNRLAAEALGWEPRHSDLATIVGTAWNWFLKAARSDHP